MTPIQKFSDPTLPSFSGLNFNPFFFFAYSSTRISFGQLENHSMVRARALTHVGLITRHYDAGFRTEQGAVNPTSNFLGNL
jgi:hypothetical protein